MRIETCVVGVTATNCYLITNKNTKETVIIDPGDLSKTIIAKIEELELKPVAIMLTHGHFDHIMATNIISDEYDVEVYAAASEESLLNDPSLNCSSLIRHNYLVKPDVLLDNYERVTLAGFNFETIYTPGHTNGGACYYIKDEEIVFSGDTLFLESVGRTDLPTGDMRSLRHSIVNHLFTLPNNVTVYPGHGPKTTIGHEKNNNPFLQDYR